MSRFLNDLIPYPNGELGRRKGDRRKKSSMQLVLRKGDRWKKSAKQLVLRKGDRRKKWLVFGWKVVGKKIKSSQAKKSIYGNQTYDLKHQRPVFYHLRHDVSMFCK